jgi:uncharacterized protein YjbJ (UPF0337 family)
MADETAGKVKHVGGKIKETVGDVLGDREMKRDGRLSQIEGEAEQDQARAEDVADEAATRKRAARTERKLNDR